MEGKDEEEEAPRLLLIILLLLLLSMSDNDMSRSKNVSVTFSWFFLVVAIYFLSARACGVGPLMDNIDSLTPLCDTSNLWRGCVGMR